MMVRFVKSKFMAIFKVKTQLFTVKNSFWMHCFELSSQTKETEVPGSHLSKLYM